MKKILYILVLVVLSGALIWTNWPSVRAQKDTSSFAEREKKYPYLSKRILLDYPADLLINFRALRTELHDTVTPYGENFGFFFEYLPTGTSIGVNEKKEFTAASLLKVPIVMAYYYGREREKETKYPVATVQQSDISERFGTLWKKGAGTKIPLDEAIKLALTESDNTAINIVSRYSVLDDFYAVSEGLDIEIVQEQDTPIITLKLYSSILKALFYSSIITKDDSEKVLDLLTQSHFRDKLVAGVDKNIKVANKVGVLEGKLYTDCGIVYLPRRSYLLCMVSASDEDTARKRMKLVSRKVFQFLKSARART